MKAPRREVLNVVRRTWKKRSEGHHWKDGVGNVCRDAKGAWWFFPAGLGPFKTATQAKASAPRLTKRRAK